MTILYEERNPTRAEVDVSGDALWLTAADLHEATGWKLETEGLCRGDACVRVEDTWRAADGRLDLTAFARSLGQPLTRDEEVVAVGASVGTRHAALFSLEAPDFTLPDLDGVMHSLSDYRGRKVFLHSWGSY